MFKVRVQASWNITPTLVPEDTILTPEEIREAERKTRQKLIEDELARCDMLKDASCSVEVAYAPEFIFEPDKTPVGEFPPMTCPHCGHTGHQGWDLIEEGFTSRELLVQGANWEYGMLGDTDGTDSVAVLCPQCSKECSIPESFFDWTY
jgi:hypothetical protein